MTTDSPIRTEIAYELPNAVLLHETYEPITSWTFISTNHKNPEAPPMVLGRFEGNIHDQTFIKMLNRVRGRLWASGIYYSESPGRTQFRETQRMTDRERYERKMSSNFRKFSDRVLEIKNTGGLFWKTMIDDLCKEYKAAIPIIKQRYNQTL